MLYIETKEFNVINSDKNKNPICDLINKFILNKSARCSDFKVIDIKYSVITLDDKENTFHSALLIYSFVEKYDESKVTEDWRTTCLYFRRELETLARRYHNTRCDSDKNINDHFNALELEVLSILKMFNNLFRNLL